MPLPVAVGGAATATAPAGLGEPDGAPWRAVGRVPASLLRMLVAGRAAPVDPHALWRVELAAAEGSDARRGSWAALLIALAHTGAGLCIADAAGTARWLLWPLSAAEAWALDVGAEGPTTGLTWKLLPPPAASRAAVSAPIGLARAATTLPLAALQLPQGKSQPH